MEINKIFKTNKVLGKGGLTKKEIISKDGIFTPLEVRLIQQ